ncbi:energy transducer TonB [Chromobacterium rhizoryzae]|uniref:energy transducer TonB n=1 Tax=Chromobacterium rhizoryzae TaxID=1778675 RepID=UPI001D06D7C8|nr:energy transducer TonB [Chromobacterium rhizoryzae]
MSTSPLSPSTSSATMLPLGLTLLASLLVHALLFSLEIRPRSSPPAPVSAQIINVQLNQTPSRQTPKTRRLAEQNNLGAGNSAQSDKLASHRAKPVAAPAEPGTPEPADASPRQQTMARPPEAGKKPALPAAQSGTVGHVSAGSLLAQVGDLSRQLGDSGLTDKEQESGGKQGKLAESARGYPWARYQEDWRLKVERIGNLNYPEAARRQNIHGAVTLEVLIAADGGLRDVRVLRSSGFDVLDEAARRIVELAAPYAPFPASLAEQSSSQRIRQKFVFTRDNQLSSR